MISIKLSENEGRAPEAVPFMPAGQHSICATVNGKPGRRVVNVDREACERLQADLAEHLRASAAGEKARPMLMFDHAAGNAAAKPLGFEWDDERGILLRVEWTQAGREAVEGGNYGYISPAFRLAKGTGEILGLAGGVEVGSLVNDPAFERNECIAAAREDDPEDVQVDYVETANPYGCNQHGHREGHKGGSSKSGKEDFIHEATPDWLKEMIEDWEKKQEKKSEVAPDRIGQKPKDYIPSADIKEFIEKLREEYSKNKAKKSEPEYLMSSVPPREEVENIAREGDNTDVAKNGGANKQKKNMEEIKKMLGLPDDADDAAVLSAIRSLKAQGAEAKTKTEEVAAECEKHKKALADHKEKSADAFIKRLQKDGTIAPKDEERAKAARTLFMADPEQAETLFCGLRAAHSEVVGDEVRANRVTEASASDYSNKSLEELLNEN